jgi:hypothetical protein
MTDTSSIQDRLEQGTGLGETLDAAFEAFQQMLSVIGSYNDSGAPFYAALVMASAPVADGREAVARAPSLPATSPARTPPRRGRWPSTPPVADAAADAAASVIALSKAVVSALLHAANLADIAEDREACCDAARYASEIHRLVAGNEA